MPIGVRVFAQGFASLLVVLGAILLLAGYYANNASEVSSGWPLIVVGIVIWFISLVIRKLG